MEKEKKEGVKGREGKGKRRGRGSKGRGSKGKKRKIRVSCIERLFLVNLSFCVDSELCRTIKTNSETTQINFT